MIHTEKVDENRQSHAAAQPAPGDAPLAQSYFAPPPAKLYVATGTPDFQPGFRIICRGDEYGTETSLAFRQITERNAPYERFCGVAVELQSLAENASRRAVIERARADLTLPGTTISTQVPTFISVPAPEKTILFLAPKDPSTTPGAMMREIKQHFSELSSGTSHSPSEVLPIARPSERQTVLFPQSYAEPHAVKGVTLGTIYHQAGEMITTLKASNLFPKWREFNWTSLQMTAVEALRPMIAGTNPADCVAPYRAKLKQYYRNPGVNDKQLDMLVTEFVRIATELYKGPNLKQAETASA